MQKERAAGPDVNIERREGKGAGRQQEEGGEGARGGEAGVQCDGGVEGVCGVDTDPAKKGKLSNFVRFSCSNCDKLWGSPSQ